MNTPKKETIDQAIQRLRDKFSYENLTKISKFSHITRQKHAQMLKFAEAVAISLLDSYLRKNNISTENE
jgi:hypothetical protein